MKSKSSIIFDFERRFDPWSRMWWSHLPFVPVLQPSLSMADESTREQKRLNKTGSIKYWWSAWILWKMEKYKLFNDWLQVSFEPIILCFPEIGESIRKFESTWFASWLLVSNILSGLSYCPVTNIRKDVTQQIKQRNLLPIVT